jgi:ribonuclease BN (tRNA processing enzyme)
MTITILGSGTITSPANRNPAGYLMEHKGHFFLVDCGPGIFKTLINLKIDVLRIGAIFLTHFHQDHCSDVMALLMRRYLLDDNSDRLTILGPPGLSHWFDTLSSLQGDWLNDNKPNIKGLNDHTHQWHDLKVTIHKTGHTNNSIAYKFACEEKCIFFSGDTGYSEELAAFAIDVDIAVIECSYSDLMEQPNHMTPLKVAMFINQAKIKQTILTHIYPENDTTDLLQRVKKHTSLPVSIGFDLMKLSL